MLHKVFTGIKRLLTGKASPAKEMQPPEKTGEGVVADTAEETGLPASLPPELVGSHLGKVLLERGYTGFEPNRSYHIKRPDANGVVEVHAWCDEDPPDEDGFGREDYYDWWYLDEQLKEIPGVEMIHCYSHQEMRMNPDIFGRQYRKAAEELRKRKNL